MKKKDISFAEEAQRIESKYYKIRKPGDDKMTDEAFNREMQKLMEKQESVKQAMQPQSPQNMQGLEPQSPQGMNPEQLMAGIGGNEQQFRNGGNLPMFERRPGYSSTFPNTGYNPYDIQSFDYDNNYSNGSFGKPLNSGFQAGFNMQFNNPNYQQVDIPQTQIPSLSNGDFGYNAMRTKTNFGTEPSLGVAKHFGDKIKLQNELEAKGVRFGGEGVKNTISAESQPNNAEYTGGKSSGQYSPTANILGPLLTTATSAISSHILDKNLQRNKKNLLNGINVNLGRINPQQIDLGRERTNIRSNAALTESSGRYASKGARSASEAAMIQNMARLGSQRESGNQLSQSYSREELTNADLRQKAAEINMQNAGRENMIEGQQRQEIESQYGGAGARIWSDFAKSTGQTMGNYLSESQRMKQDYDFMNMAADNHEMDYQAEYNKLNPYQKFLRRQLGIGNVNGQIRVRNYEQKK